MNAGAAGLVLVTAFIALARRWWFFDLFTHFRLQYVAAALVLGLAALATKAYPAAVVLAAVALVHGWAVRDLWRGGEAAEGQPLRVASINVLRSNPKPQCIIDFVRGADADVVVLIEAQTARWRGVLAEIGTLYPHAAPEGWDGAAPTILFSRYPILRHSPADPLDGPWPYLTADIAVDGRVLAFVAAHPSAPQLNDPRTSRLRNAQLDRLESFLADQDGPMIVTGDFNISPWSPHFHDLLAATGLRNAAAGHGWVPTWPHWFPPVLIPIDHVLVRGSVAVAGFQRGPYIGSDHYPIIADLRLTDSCS